MSKLKDLTNQRFGRLVVVKKIPSKKTRWLCQCDCGNTKEVNSGELKKGNTKSCGCLRKDVVRNDLKNQMFNNCKALKFLRIDEDGASVWLFKCLNDAPGCKGTFEARGSYVKTGKIKSCGCLYMKHGMSHAPEYDSYRTMIKRCYDKNHKDYPNYGGRGIKVCDRWLESFENFYEDMGPRPNPDDTLERKENEDIYSPDNCSWEDRVTQNRNRRCNKINSIEEAEHIRDVYNNHNWSVKNIAEFFRCHIETIRNIINRKTWS